MLALAGFALAYANRKDTELTPSPVIDWLVHAETLPSALKVVRTIELELLLPVSPPTRYRTPPNTTGVLAANPPDMVFVVSTHQIFPQRVFGVLHVDGAVMLPFDEIAV